MNFLANTRVRSAVAVFALSMATAGALWFTSTSPAQAKIYPRLIADDCSSCPSFIEGPGYRCDLTDCNTVQGVCNYFCYSTNP